MPVQILQADAFVIELDTRMPFKYGIATMTRAPHLFVRVVVRVDGEEFTGVSADHLPPKWFTKVAEKPIGEEVREMMDVVQHALEVARGMSAETAFDLWQELYDRQLEWGKLRRLPPLLSNFGATFVERGLIEAVCKLNDMSFEKAVRQNVLGIRLDALDSRLAGLTPAELLPKASLRTVIARHTVGMADPLVDSDIPANDRLNDGLPQSLAACIDTYGLRHLKVKLSGDIEQDIDRLQQVTGVLASRENNGFLLTLDGNEQFRSLRTFQDYWERFSKTESVAFVFDRLMFVEQPFHREMALDEDMLSGLTDWSNRPPIIIDESDAEIESIKQAVQLGYNGTSHKNCKGVFKGVFAACLLEFLRRGQPSAKYIMSGEDLANIGPVALLQDLAVAAALGVNSVERNGHHYFAGLSAFPRLVHQQVLEAHADLYHQGPREWPCLKINQGVLRLDTVIDAPLGVGFELDVEQFSPIDAWQDE